MARLFVLVILVLVVGVIKSDESRQLKKVNKKKFLFNLLNVLRKLRSHKKTESSQTISLDQITWPQLAANHQTQVKDVVPIPNKILKYHGYSERSDMRKSPSKSNKLAQKRKKEFLINLLKTLKRIRSRKKTAHSKSTDRKSTSFVKLESQISRPFAKDDTFKASYNPAKKTIISDPKQKFDERSNTIKPIEELANSGASRESKARYSFAMARLSFLEALEKAQEKKLNKLSKVEKEFAVILPQKTDENILGEQKTKLHSLQNVAKVENGTTLDNIPSSYDNLQSSKSVKKKNPLDISLNVSSKTIKNEHSRIDKTVVKGKKNIELQSAKFPRKNRRAKKIISPQLHSVTPWINPTRPLANLSLESTNGNKHVDAMKNKLRKFQNVKKAFSALVNKFLVTHTFSNKSKNLARLQKLQQKILLSFRENKIKSAVSNENMNNKKNPQIQATGGSFQDKAQNKSILNVPAHFMSNKYDFSNLQSTSAKVNEFVQNETKKNPTDSPRGGHTAIAKNIVSNFPLHSLSRLTPKQQYNLVTSHSGPGRFGLNNQAVTTHIKRERLHQNPGNVANTTYKFGQNIKEKIREMERPQSVLWERAHENQNKPSDLVEARSASSVYSVNNHAVAPRPYTIGQNSSTWEKIEQNKLLQPLSGLANKGPHKIMHEMQNQSPSHVVSSFASNKIGLKNSTGTLELGINSVARQASQYLKNNTKVTKLSAALQKAQSIFLSKVKEILVGHSKNKDGNSNHFSDINNQDNNNQKSDESVINSSAYVMDESPPTTPAPENHDNAGIVPTTPPNSALPLSTGNVMSPVMQQPNMGFNAPGQGLTQSTSMSNSPVQASITGQPLSYTQQQDAHLEEQIAAEQNNAFQNRQNSFSSSINGGNLPYQAPSSFTGSNPFPEVRHNYAQPNAGFRLPNVDDLDEYRGGMERYQLAHSLGFSHTGYDVDDESPRRSHFHHYAHDDEDYNDDDEDEDNDEYADDKKKSHIRKPHGHKKTHQNVFANTGTATSRPKHTQMSANKHAYRKL